jgi:uncharacterized membrane protein
MKQPDYPKELLLAALLLAPMIYLGIVWNSIPIVVPPDFNAIGAPGGPTGGRTEIMLLMIFLFVTNAMLYFLFRYIPNIEGEPPPEAAAHLKKYYRVRFMIHIYLAVFTMAIIFMVSKGKELLMERWAFIGIGLLIIAIGAVLKDLPPNNYVGVRTPCTLKSAEVWKATHRMASTLWISAGVVIILCSFFLKIVTGVFVIIFAVFVLAALPYIYSYRLYNTNQG